MDSILHTTTRAIYAAQNTHTVFSGLIPEIMNGVPFPWGPVFRVPLPGDHSLSISFLTQGNLPEVALFYGEDLTSRPEWGYYDSESYPIGDGVSLTSDQTMIRLILEINRLDSLISQSN